MKITQFAGTWNCLAAARRSAIALAALVCFTAGMVQSQTFAVLHGFGQHDSGFPNSALVMDQVGNFYGTTPSTVYKLTHVGPNWILSNLQRLHGEDPTGVTIGPDGTLVGTTQFGGGGDDICGESGCGTVFDLSPPASICRSIVCYWNLNNTFLFADAPGVISFPASPVIFDAAGNMYGTATQGQAGCQENGYGCGAVWELSKVAGQWQFTVLHTFTGGSGDGAEPYGRLAFDRAGNLYGTTMFGGLGDGGTVFQLTPSSSGWTETILYKFLPGDSGPGGNNPSGGVTIDSAGNLFGGASNGGSGGGGTIFELSRSGGNWTYSTLYNLSGTNHYGPWGSLAMTSAGTLYGVTWEGGAYSAGSVFQLTPSGSGWAFTTLHDFTAGNDGAYPEAGVILDAAGNLYGTTESQGSNGLGVIYELTP